MIENSSGSWQFDLGKNSKGVYLFQLTNERDVTYRVKVVKN